LDSVVKIASLDASWATSEIICAKTCHTRQRGRHGATLEELHGQTLQTAIERGANPNELPESFLLSHRREGEECPRGNGKIRKTSAAGRTAYYCPACQPEE
jgi:formamidopyrimidine-DNA glycosylase